MGLRAATEAAGAGRGAGSALTTSGCCCGPRTAPGCVERVGPNWSPGCSSGLGAVNTDEIGGVWVVTTCSVAGAPGASLSRAVRSTIDPAVGGGGAAGKLFDNHAWR